MTVLAFVPAGVRIIRTYLVHKKSIYRKIRGKESAKIRGIQMPGRKRRGR